jgi:hypothetical protein
MKEKDWLARNTPAVEVTLICKIKVVWLAAL